MLAHVKHPPGKGAHAVVIGASMAGMLAARILCERFERVTLVEQDLLQETPEPRKGVPQARHLHILMERGRHTLERLFPGLTDEMIAAGAPFLDMAADLSSLTAAGWEVRFSSDLRFLSFSRGLLDLHVRRRLDEYGGVSFLQGHEAQGLLSDGESGVAGVRVSGEPLRANLVVDASGRGSRLPRWLEELGYERPSRSTVDAHLGYASRIYERPPGFRSDWRGLVLRGSPPEYPRGGVLLPIEEGRWIVTLAGGDHDHPSTDGQEFVEFAASLRDPSLYEAIKHAEPLTPAYGYKATQNRLNHYERLPRWPEGLLTLGASVCAFTPVYGQGMTTAALGAETLEKCLREGGMDGLEWRFQKRLARVNRAPWALAANEDHRYQSTQSTEGAGPDLSVRLLQPYLSQIERLCTHDPETRLTLLRTYNMLDRPGALFRPRILARALHQAAGFQRPAAGKSR